MIRSMLVAGLLLGFLGSRALSQPEASLPSPKRSKADRLPRKVVVGTTIFGRYGTYEGLEARLKALSGLIETMAGEAEERFPGRGLDLAVLPEEIVTAVSGPALRRAAPLEGPIQETFSALARKHSTYIVVPMTLAEMGSSGPIASNAAVLFDRQGKVVGIYRKVHPVDTLGNPRLENGMTPGAEYPVFECDFGRLGIQICWDIQYEEGWRSLVEQGADLIAWPSQSPATVLPAARAAELRTYIVSSTWREDATIFEPTGMPAAQIEGSDGILVHEIDLSYALLGWSPTLEDGKALDRKFGDKVGHHYSRREDFGLFWSNDPATSIGAMYRSLGLEEVDVQVERNRPIQEAARVAAGRRSIPSVYSSESSSGR